MKTSPIRDHRRVTAYLFVKLGSAVQAQIITAIWWWQPYAKAKRNGKHWVVKTDQDFQDDGITASPRAIRGAIAELKKKEIIRVTRGPHPNGRAPNARYLWLDQSWFEELEAIAKSGKSRRVGNRVESADYAELKTPNMPLQHGSESRFHIQNNDNKTSKETNNKKEIRNPSRKGVSKEIIPKKENFVIEKNELKVQQAFDEGCREHYCAPGPAPALDDPKRLACLRRYICAVLDAKYTIDDAAAGARQFGERYDPHDVAAHLARHVSKVSQSPTHVVLGMLANVIMASLNNTKSTKLKAKTANEAFATMQADDHEEQDL